MTLTKAERVERTTRYTELLKEWIPAGSTIKTVVTHVSRSGMSRSIRALVPLQRADGSLTIADVSYMAADVLGWKVDERHGGVKIGGCGMDMGFHLVYTLSRKLYGAQDGAGDAGYILKQSWL